MFLEINLGNQVKWDGIWWFQGRDKKEVIGISPGFQWWVQILEDAVSVK